MWPHRFVYGAFEADRTNPRSPQPAYACGGSAGEAAVVSAIYNFRKALTDVLRTQVGGEADNQTIVCSGGTGYRFSDSVTFRDARNAVPVQAPEVETPACRRELILTLLRQSVSTLLSPTSTLT